jgi:hypothetical protein
MDQLHELEALIRQFAPQAVIYGLMGLGALVIMGYAYVQVTPNQDDDAWVKKIEEHKIFGAALRLLLRFSPVQRK